MKSKKAQVTLFVIIAVVVVASVLLVYSTGMFQKLKESAMPEQVNVVKTDIDSCVEKSAQNAVSIISAQGGYVYPDSYFLDGNLMVGYWFYDTDTSPNTDKVEEDLSDLACLLIEDCVNLDKYDITASSKDCTAKATIKTDRVDIEIIYPVSMTIADKAYSFNEFSAKVDVGLGKVENIGKEIVAEQAEHPEEICLTCLADIGEENNVLIDVNDKNESKLVTITDENSEIFDNPYQFNFAIRV